ncbi:hypothetical protein MKW98_001720 [Papaver atlanticum]|uniref:MIF4G domain-containing protein n=1 Tax=Papaver atlanticum TaxID=357466 RepID=A0AAD4X8S9_9MAGN|nr:hypothetical protein MKW98_001720 [Papaver atlanticum]
MRKTFQLSLLIFIISSAIFFILPIHHPFQLWQTPVLSQRLEKDLLFFLVLYMKAEVSWMSTVRGDLSYKECILRRVRGILNKLTVEKYTLLRNQLIDSRITTLSILDGVASLIFNKALTEPMFCPLYAFLCYELSLPPHGLPSVPDECVQQEITFKRLLVSKCQEAFENENRKVAETRQQIVTGVSSDVRYKERRRNLGEMQFICELMKQRHPILRISLAHHILYQLLDPNDVEVNVEAICLFLNTVGK